MPPKIKVNHLKRYKKKFGKTEEIKCPEPLKSLHTEEVNEIVLSKSLTHIPVTTTSASHTLVATHAVDNDIGVQEVTSNSKEINVLDVEIPQPKSAITSTKGKKKRVAPVSSTDIDDNSTASTASRISLSSSTTAPPVSTKHTLKKHKKKTVTIDV